MAYDFAKPSRCLHYAPRLWPELSRCAIYVARLSRPSGACSTQSHQSPASSGPYPPACLHLRSCASPILANHSDHYPRNCPAVRGIGGLGRQSNLPMTCRLLCLFWPARSSLDSDACSVSVALRGQNVTTCFFMTVSLQPPLPHLSRHPIIRLATRLLVAE